MKDLVEKLRQSENQIAESHKHWQEKTKPLIQSVLEELKTSLDLHADVEVNDAIINHETVYFSFGKKPSGLSYNQENFFNEEAGLNGLLMKDGGALFYTIGYRGEVLIWMSFPFVPGIIEQEDNYHEIHVMDQKDISQQSIHDDVKYFIEQITLWNKGEVGKEKIGFKISNQQ